MDERPLTQTQQLTQLLAEAEEQGTSKPLVDILRILIDSDMKNREAIQRLQGINYQRSVAAR